MTLSERKVDHQIQADDGDRSRGFRVFHRIPWYLFRSQTLTPIFAIGVAFNFDAIKCTNKQDNNWKATIVDDDYPRALVADPTQQRGCRLH
jgi:hypothetical protein